jgi:sterol desaturase/sphingolipid hydroxylase (fatty acid hydroxylase superfamily)
MKKLPGWLSAVLVGGAFAALLWRESRRPLRRAVESKPRRDARNLSMAALSAAAINLTERPVVAPLAELVARRRWGLLPRLRLPGWVETTAAVVLMDYTLYLWHVLTHRVPLLWRFHQVHHVDLDLDTSTALRFHFGEMVLSVPWRAAQVLLIGVSPRALSLWQTLTLIEVLFHHSNAELPAAVERRLCRFIVTPRMHGIHHSIVPEEQNANWSSGLTVWDWLHGTLRLNVPQEEIVVGVPAYREPAEVTLPKLIALPFEEMRDPWQLPGDGVPRRRLLAAPKAELQG